MKITGNIRLKELHSPPEMREDDYTSWVFITLFVDNLEVTIKPRGISWSVEFKKLMAGECVQSIDIT